MIERVAGTVALVLVLVGVAGGDIEAQTPASVRVGTHAAQVRARPSADAEVVLSAEPGSILDVVDSDGQWYWISIPPDRNGGRRRGWIQARDVQPVSAAEVNALIRDLNNKVEQLQRQVQALQPAGRPARTSTIPPTAEDIRAQARIEKARREAEERRRDYEAALQRRAEQAAGGGVAQLPTSRAAYTTGYPQYKIFGGYAAFWDQSDSLSFPMGWVASVAHPMSHSVAIAGEVSGSYKTVRVLSINVASASVHTFTAGPQFSGQLGRATTFGQVLGGLAVTSGPLLGFGTSSTGLALTPGAGVDISIGRGLGLRLGGELGLVHDAAGWYNGFRLTTGLVLIGRK